MFKTLDVINLIQKISYKVNNKNKYTVRCIDKYIIKLMDLLISLGNLLIT